MRSTMLDFSSWSSLLTTLLSLLVITFLMVGIRLLFMQTLQKRRERENRQINERLKTLIAAYKTLGGSFTGRLTVTPLHLRALQAATMAAPAAELAPDSDAPNNNVAPPTSSERQRRMRDAVEAALSDVILLGTEEQVHLAAQAAQDMVAGRHIETAALVASLRRFIRAALDLEPIPASVAIPSQGPTRTAGGGTGARRAGGSTAEGGGKGTGGGGAAGSGMGSMGMGVGLGSLGRGERPGPDDTAP